MRKIGKSALAGAAVAWLAACPASAQDEPAALAARVEQALANGNSLVALDLASGYPQVVWDRAPLAFRKAVLVDVEPTEFGQFVARSTDVYDEDEEIHIYLEPVAFGWKQIEPGWETDIVADVRVATPDGKIIAGHKDFSEFRIAAPSRNTDIFLSLTYVFGGLGQGDYVITTTLRDQVAAKSAAVSTPISIR